MLGALAPGAAMAASGACDRLPATPTLKSSDPTAFADDAGIVVRAAGGARLSALRVELRRGRTVVASGSRAGTVSTGAVTVPVRVVKRVGAGTYHIVVVGRRDGCTLRTSTARAVKLSSPSLPVRATPTSTLAADQGSGVGLVVRTVAGRRITGLRAALADARGATVARAAHDAPFTGAVELTLPVDGAVAPGSYTLKLDGRSDGVAASSTQPLSLGGGATPAPEADPRSQSGLTRQALTVDWSGGRSAGREAAGFVVPGIGYGEVVCRRDAQWIRFFPGDRRREVSMMNWTYRDWSQDREKALREALHTRFTGPDFREGLNKFSPAEKRSTGQFDGIVSDRGPIGGPGGSFAAPTSLRLTWEWDFSDDGRERCHVEATFTSEAESAERPLARSASVVWRGEANAPGRDRSAVDVPGLGRMTVVCEPGTDGTRTLRVDTPQGATVTTRESSEDPSAPQEIGPVTAQLPNNGQLAWRFADGSTLIASSRWKVNDPDPAENSCAVATQVVTP